MSEQKQNPKCKIIRVGDGKNFINSKYPFWGVISKYKSSVKKFKKGDILCFITSMKYGAKIIGMAEYTEFYDRTNEPLLSINTKTNDDQGWVGGGEWDIQIHYRNLYITPNKTHIGGIIKGQCSILNYDNPKIKEQIKSEHGYDLYTHYNHFQIYLEPKTFANL